jgi:hypothetical protein
MLTTTYLVMATTQHEESASHEDSRPLTNKTAEAASS